MTDDVRTHPLSTEEIEGYRTDGYISPIQVLSQDEVAILREAIDEHLAGKIDSEQYELTDYARIRRVPGPDGTMLFEYEGDDDDADTSETSKRSTFPFLFNLWKVDERFAAIGRNPVIAGIARQLIGCDEVLLFEDNSVIKRPHTSLLPWHQDYSYWPLEEPAAVTAWIAIDHITEENGAMQVVPRSHELGERLPVRFGSSTAFMQESRPDIPEVPQDPASEGRPILSYGLQPGQCGFHHPLLWHASSPNTTARPRTAFVLRYVATGTIWLGAARFPYDDVGCPIGNPLSGAHFPAVATAF